jgi:hypothetical protein
MSVLMTDPEPDSVGDDSLPVVVLEKMVLVAKEVRTEPSVLISVDIVVVAIATAPPSVEPVDEESDTVESDSESVADASVAVKVDVGEVVPLAVFPGRPEMAIPALAQYSAP